MAQQQPGFGRSGMMSVGNPGIARSLDRIQDSSSFLKFCDRFWVCVLLGASIQIESIEVSYCSCSILRVFPAWNSANCPLFIAPSPSNRSHRAGLFAGGTQTRPTSTRRHVLIPKTVWAHRSGFRPLYRPYTLFGVSCRDHIFLNVLFALRFFDPKHGWI